MGITNPTMEKTLSSQATNWREGRRLRAFELKVRGWKQTQIAEALGVSEGAVSQWMKRATEEGAEGLRHKPPPGAPSRLSENERAKLPELLARGAEAHGFRGRGMDLRKGSYSDPQRVRSQLSSGACESGGASARTLLAKTTAPG
jgi:transposase